MEFVGLDQEPYGCITDDPPDILVVCLRIEDAVGFQFLSMLQIDPATRHPGITYTTEAEGQLLPGVDDVAGTPLHIAARGAQARAALML